MIKKILRCITTATDHKPYSTSKKFNVQNLIIKDFKSYKLLKTKLKNLK